MLIVIDREFENPIIKRGIRVIRKLLERSTDSSDTMYNVLEPGDHVRLSDFLELSER